LGQGAALEEPVFFDLTPRRRQPHSSVAQWHPV
jgi:hypothetical protein